MKKLFQSIITLTLLFFYGSVVFSFAQSEKDSAPPAKSKAQIVRDLVRDKHSRSPFVFVNPSDLAKLPSGEMRSLLSTDPCDILIPIEIGQTVGAALDTTDCRLQDNSYADLYVFSGTQGQQIRLQMDSSEVDSYLGLANESGTFVLEDDDSGGGTSALITTTLPETGLFLILANSVFANDFGGYYLSLSGPTACAFSVSPANMNVPASGGTFSFSVLTQPECQWRASNSYPYITTSSFGTGPGTATFTINQNGSGVTRTNGIQISSVPNDRIRTSFGITQPSISNCMYSLDPASVNLPAFQTSGTFNITATDGCPWTVQSNSYLVTASGSGIGNGTVSYSVMHNNGNDRILTISLGGQTFTINQAGLNCSWTISPRVVNVPRAGMSGVITVATQPGCTWSSVSNQTWLRIFPTSGSGSGAVSYEVLPQNEPQNRSAANQVFYTRDETSNSTSTYFDQSGNFSLPDFDFTGDGKSDYGIFRPTLGSWYLVVGEPNYFATYYMGSANDKIVPADYSGDGRMDMAYFCPSEGNWYFNVIAQGPTTLHFGQTGDIPVPADYDNDGIDDIAVFRPSNGVWYIRRSSDLIVTFTQFGSGEDVPVPADYDGDGKADISVWRPSNGTWYRLNSINNSFFAIQFGASEDKPVAADFDGDRKTDIAVWRPSSGVWYRINSSNSAFLATQFGSVSDLPVPADYDGDGKTDIGVFRPAGGTWYLLRSNLGFTTNNFGINGDIPLPNAFIRQ